MMASTSYSGWLLIMRGGGGVWERPGKRLSSLAVYGLRRDEWNVAWMFILFGRSSLNEFSPNLEIMRKGPSNL